ncbi:MAG TPA: ABC transporter permease [Flavobacteriales bacterium]|nr:ABC transporter permease [Flavobacteriales bacterium]HIA10586.1 ABC transporter permease [Flavobacteriales bacterium]HIO71689.1 ABC transporter permease [Flavobacteriales bacterium]
MKVIWIIAKRELKSFFDSLTAYIMLIIFLGLSGFFTWLYGSDVFLVGQASLQSFFAVAYWTLFFFTPAITMRTIAEEKRTGTIELILTKSVSDWQLIVGKYLACLMLIGVALLSTLPFYFTLTNIGPVDHGAVICGYLGLLLMSSAYISIGIFSSCITNNQIVSFLLSLLIGVFFLIIFQALSSNFTGVIGSILSYLSISDHYQSLSRGVIDSRDIIYFVSITVFALMMAESYLIRRNLSEK